MPIAFIAQQNNDTNSTSLTVSGTINTGDTAVVVVDVGVNLSVSTVADSGGSAYTLQTARTWNSDTRFRTEIWGVLSATASTSVTITATAAALMNAGVLRYSGVGSFGLTTGNDGNSTNPTVSLGIQGANNWVVGGFGVRASKTNSTENGTFRINNANLNQGSLFLDVLDNTAASTGTVTNSFTYVGAQIWGAAAVELRLPAAAGSVVAPRSLALLGVGV